MGSAEAIDRQRRVVRKLDKNGITVCHEAVAPSLEDESIMKSDDTNKLTNNLEQSQSSTKSKSKPKHTSKKKKPNRRVVRKAFYSDEEDESSEEDWIPQVAMIASRSESVASTMRQRNVLGFGGGMSGVDGNYGPHGVGCVADATGAVE